VTFSGINFCPRKILALSRLRHSAALWYGSRRGHFSPRNLSCERWDRTVKVAYVQPSRRPTDGRYGENPNRLQHYYQYQVIMKPSPVNIRNSTLIRSRVSALIPLITTFALSRTTGNLRHWAPGAWAGRFGSTAWKYPNSLFPASGRVWSSSVCAELTYGTERIAMYIQGINNVLICNGQIG